jgi:hypothetical protein
MDLSTARSQANGMFVGGIVATAVGALGVIVASIAIGGLQPADRATGLCCVISSLVVFVAPGIAAIHFSRLRERRTNQLMTFHQLANAHPVLPIAQLASVLGTDPSEATVVIREALAAALVLGTIDTTAGVFVSARAAASSAVYEYAAPCINCRAPIRVAVPYGGTAQCPYCRCAIR